MLPGPLPAGSYHITFSGYQANDDAVTHVDVLWRRAGAADTTVVSADGAPVPANPDASFDRAGLVDAMVTGAAVPASCGDSLVIRVRFVSGTSDFLEAATSLGVP